MDELTRRTWWRTCTVVSAALLLLGGIVSHSSAQLVGVPGLVGQWTEPFEESGAGTPRCGPAQNDTPGYMLCKPTAAAAAVLPDGRIFYYNGFEGQENAKGPSAMSLSPSMRDDSSRVLDLRSDTPQWIVPAGNRGGQSNPNIKPGHPVPGQGTQGQARLGSCQPLAGSSNPAAGAREE